MVKILNKQSLSQFFMYYTQNRKISNALASYITTTNKSKGPLTYQGFKDFYKEQYPNHASFLQQKSPRQKKIKSIIQQQLASPQVKKLQSPLSEIRTAELTTSHQTGYSSLFPVFLFLDNDKKKFLGAKQAGIQQLHIEDNEPHSFFQEGDRSEFSYAKNYSIHQKVTVPNSVGERKEENTSNGITNHHIDKVKKWCEDYEHRKKIVFIDWDRTITVVEGFIANLSLNNFRDELLFVIGGKARLKQMQEFFKYLRKHDVDVFIVTNNGFCTKGSGLDDPNEVKYQQYFVSMVKILDPDIQEDNILCTRYTQPTSKQSNKIVYLKHSGKLEWYKPMTI